jgi:hypothetical protein
MRNFVFVPMLLFASALVAPALADDDASATCVGDPRLERGYRAGFQGGVNLVDRAWRSGDGCADLPRIERVVLDALARLVVPPGASPYVRCRAIGVGDGAEQQLYLLRSSYAREGTDETD